MATNSKHGTVRALGSVGPQLHAERHRCPTLPPTTTSSSTTRRPAAAPPSCSCTSMPATTAAGSRRCGIWRSATVASPSMLVASALRGAAEVASYSQRRAADDIRAVLDALKIDKAHIVGLSMGGLATLHFGLAYSDRARSLLVAGAGYGSAAARRRLSRRGRRLSPPGSRSRAWRRSRGNMLSSTRVQFENKDPRGFAEFKAMLAEHSAEGSAYTQLGVQRERPSVFDLVEGRGPAHRSDACRDRRRGLARPFTGVLMKRTCPRPRCWSRRTAVTPSILRSLTSSTPPATSSSRSRGRWPMRDPAPSAKASPA